MLRLIAALLMAALVGCRTSSPATSPAQDAGRVDVLNAADAAMERGDPTTASGLYERVLNTPSTGEAGDISAAIDTYAHFRDVVALLGDGREDDARAQLDALQQADPSAPFARLATQLWDQYGMVGSLRGACAQVQPEIDSQTGATLTTLQGVGLSVDPSALCSAPGAGS